MLNDLLLHCDQFLSLLQLLLEVRHFHLQSINNFLLCFLMLLQQYVDHTRQIHTQRRDTSQPLWTTHVKFTQRDETRHSHYGPHTSNSHREMRHVTATMDHTRQIHTERRDTSQSLWTTHVKFTQRDETRHSHYGPHRYMLHSPAEVCAGNIIQQVAFTRQQLESKKKQKSSAIYAISKPAAHAVCCNIIDQSNCLRYIYAM